MLETTETFRKRRTSLVFIKCNKFQQFLINIDLLEIKQQILLHQKVQNKTSSKMGKKFKKFGHSRSTHAPHAFSTRWIDCRTIRIATRSHAQERSSDSSRVKLFFLKQIKWLDDISTTPADVITTGRAGYIQFRVKTWIECDPIRFWPIWVPRFQPFGSSLRGLTELVSASRSSRPVHWFGWPNLLKLWAKVHEPGRG